MIINREKINQTSQTGICSNGHGRQTCWQGPDPERATTYRLTVPHCNIYRDGVPLPSTLTDPTDHQNMRENKRAGLEYPAHPSMQGKC